MNQLGSEEKLPDNEFKKNWIDSNAGLTAKRAKELTAKFAKGLRLAKCWENHKFLYVLCASFAFFAVKPK